MRALDILWGGIFAGMVWAWCVQEAVIRDLRIQLEERDVIVEETTAQFQAHLARTARRPNYTDD